MGEQYDYAPIIAETRALLDSNPEWRRRYKTYAAAITKNTVLIRAVRAQVKEGYQLKLYLNTSNATGANKTVTFELRFLGQTVAKLTGSPDDLHISTKGYKEKNEKFFNCKIELDCPWKGEGSGKASEFRSFFKNHKMTENRGNEEHRLESLLLSEFSKHKDKALLNIQPVKIEGLRYPMPTPVSASDPNAVRYSERSRAGIDIFARTGHGRKTNLCIIELKDENSKKEPAAVVMKQAIKYTTFIRELIRSESGAEWWKLFGFGGERPKKLVLFAVVAMPDGKYSETSFEPYEYKIIDGSYEDIIRLHYIYFTQADNKISEIKSSLRESI